MSEMEDRINAVLNDPQQMEKITEMAKSLMGGDAEDRGADAAILGKIGRLMGSDTGENSNERALLDAMRPYLSEKRRRKMDRALKLARFAKIAGLAMNESGGGEDV